MFVFKIFCKFFFTFFKTLKNLMKSHRFLQIPSNFLPNNTISNFPRQISPILQTLLSSGLETCRKNRKYHFVMTRFDWLPARADPDSSVKLCYRVNRIVFCVKMSGGGFWKKMWSDLWWFCEGKSIIDRWLIWATMEGIFDESWGEMKEILSNSSVI